MRGEQEALFAGIVADPDDDLPRLVYADWLEEHAQTAADRARAAFIRLQIAEYRSPEPWELSGTRRPSLAALERHRGDWLASVPKRQRGWVVFERGFADVLRPGKVRVGYLPLLEKPPPELRAVRRLVLPAGNGMRPGDYDRVAASPGLGRLTELHVGNDATGPEVAALLAGPHAARLETLACTNSMSDAWAVLAAPAPPALGRLTLRAPGYATDGVRSALRTADVERSAVLRGLHDLDLVAWDSRAAVQAIGRGAGPRGLVRLAVVAPDRGTVARFDLPCLKRLTLYTASDVAGVGESISDELARCPGLTGLGALALGRPVGLTSFTRLVESAALAGLKRLDVEVAGDQGALTDYLLADAGPLRFDKLCVGRAHFTAARAARLWAKYGPKLQLHTDRELEPTLRRLGRW